jgi:outer membrane protein assembly factor BamD
MMTKGFISFCLISALMIGGCATASHRPEEKTATELLNAGLAALHKDNFSDSIDIFSKLKDWYPFSKHAVTAELKIADAHYGMEEYDEATAGYESFVNLHPRNDEVPYAIYQIGNCYLDQLKGIDQDQTYATKASDTFLRLLKQFPDSSYADLAKAALKKCQKSILRHELYVAKFYLRAKNYRAALNRFKDLLDMYPDVGVQYEALHYITLCQAAMANMPSGKIE